MKMKEILREWKIYEDSMEGGLADDVLDSDFSSDALTNGTKVELEHTDDEVLAKEIAKDHLKEDPLYYDKLGTIEKK